MAYPADRKYTKDHEWIRLSGETAEIGITEYAQQQLGEVVFVDLPEPGTTLTAGQPFGSIESVKAVSELFAPASGEVLEVNAAVKTQPDAISTAPHDTWMVRIRLSDPGALGDLLDSTRYEGLLQ